MGGKHLKRLRAEKAKVQLKKKKVLPKGQNLTDTTFRAKKIVLVEQLKRIGENEPVSSWNLTLKDLIARFNHHNHMTRFNSLTGIRELINAYPQILEGASLRTLIMRLLELLIDEEHKIRVTTISLLSDLFSKLPQHSLSPFYDLLNVHVSCAMTHRNLSIQQDSLKFIEVMVQYAPKSIEKNFSNLIDNFIRILKGLKYDHHSQTKFSKLSKQDVEKSKIEMFKKFYQLLNVIYSKLSSKENSEQNFIEIPSTQCRFDLKSVNKLYAEIPDMSSLFKLNQNSEEGSVIQEFQIECQSLVSLVVPELLNTWLEISPNESLDEFTSECLLNEGTAELLLVILQIILLLYEKTQSFQSIFQESWFISTYGKDLHKSFMINFPYLPSVATNKSGQSANPESKKKRSAYASQNLMICYLYYCFCKMGYKADNIGKKVDIYVSDALRIKNPSDYKTLLKVIEIVIETCEPDKLRYMTMAIFKVYNATSNPDYKKKLFDILSRFATSDKYSDLRETKYLKSWIETLSEELMQAEIPLYKVQTILKIISRKGGRDLLKKLEEKARLIVPQLPNIKVIGADEFEGQKLIANLFYRCGDQVLKNIKNMDALKSDSFPQRLRDYLLAIVNFKLPS